MVDLNRALRTAAQSGSIQIGLSSTRAAVAAKQAKAVVVARNLPADERTSLVGQAQAAGVGVIEFAGTNVELGPAIGKPFAVACLAVLEPGESDILHAVQG